MPTQNIAVYIKDKNYAKYLGKQKQIQEKVKQLVKEETETEGVI